MCALKAYSHKCLQFMFVKGTVFQSEKVAAHVAVAIRSVHFDNVVDTLFISIVTSTFAYCH